MSFDPNYPVDNQEIIAADFRNQFGALKALIDAQAATIADLQAQIADLRSKSALMPNLTILDAPFSNPPAEADLETIRNYVNDMASQLQGGW